MKYFRHKEDIIPVTLFSAMLVIDVMAYLYIESVWLLFSYYLITMFSKGNICSWNHHHQHYFTFKTPILNRLLEILFALQTGIVGYAWVLHHNYGHHLHYLDQSKDESRWQYKSGKTMNRLYYGLEVTLTSYYRCFIVGLKHPKILKNFLWMCFVTFSIVAILTYYRPIQGLFVFILPMITGLYLTADATFPHHSDLDTEDEFAASRNIVDSTCYNFLSGNLGYHTAHHVKYGLHWSKLPAYHEKIKHKIPDHCYMRPSLPYRIIDRFIEVLR